MCRECLFKGGSLPLGEPSENAKPVYRSQDVYKRQGPFPTELNDATGDLIRERGHEYGTVTERPRRTGWFDAVVVNQSRRMSSLTGISLMLLDVMSGFDTIKICKACLLYTSSKHLMGKEILLKLLMNIMMRFMIQHGNLNFYQV